MSKQHPIVLSGIGGQGVQLAAQVLCRAAISEGGHAQYFSHVGGAMRGGPSAAYVVVADGPVEIPPLFSWARTGVPMHLSRADDVLECVDDRSTLMLDPAMVGADWSASAATVLEIPFRSIAREVDAPGALSLVLIGAVAALTGLVGSEALIAAMHAALPAYRQDRAPVNARAIAAGHAAAARVHVEA